MLEPWSVRIRTPHLNGKPCWTTSVIQNLAFWTMTTFRLMTRGRHHGSVPDITFFNTTNTAWSWNTLDISVSKSHHSIISLKISKHLQSLLQKLLTPQTRAQVENGSGAFHSASMKIFQLLLMPTWFTPLSNNFLLYRNYMSYLTRAIGSWGWIGSNTIIRPGAVPRLKQLCSAL